MIFVKSTLAGVAALIAAALMIYALSLGVPRILAMIPSHDGGGMIYGVSFDMWQVGVVALFIFFWRMLLVFQANPAPSPESLTFGVRDRLRTNDHDVGEVLFRSDTIPEMLIHIFRGPARIFGFTADATGANLPSKFAPWTSFKALELTKDGATPGVDANTCLDDIEKYGFHITDAHVRITDTTL